MPAVRIVYKISPVRVG